MSRTPLILISNDDGFSAPGIRVLTETLRPLGDIFVVAPDGARSGAAASITSEVPIRARLLKSEPGVTFYACSGTPTDCVKLALDQLLQRQPDLVVGGINHGSNASINAHYSGTLGVAIEGAIHGIPSVAFSMCNHDPRRDLTALRPYILQIARQALEQPMPFGSLLNVNFPDCEAFAGVRTSRMTYARWVNEYDLSERRAFGRYFWLGGEMLSDEPNDEQTDLWALDHDYVAVAPLRIDLTDYDLLESLRHWRLEPEA